MYYMNMMLYNEIPTMKTGQIKYIYFFKIINENDIVKFNLNHI